MNKTYEMQTWRVEVEAHNGLRYISYLNAAMKAVTVLRASLKGVELAREEWRNAGIDNVQITSLHIEVID